MPEVLVALSVLAVGFIGVWTSAGQCLQIARAHRETIAATEVLMRRVEDCRSTGWNTILTPEGIKENILNMSATDATALPGIEEKITITPYPAVTPATTPIVVARHTNGTVEILSAPTPGVYLRAFLAVRVDFQLTWQSGSTKRPRKRELSTVISAQALLR